ncbi:MAG: Ig domain-containing protein [Lachnospiraceae bacterium]|nr:Ig domain-containing protein [Lachnospiraceae bacterium]
MYGISKIINNSKIEINARNFIETEDKYFVDSKKKSVLWDGKIGNGTYISAKAVRVKSISLKLKQTNLVKGKTINLSKQYSINPSNVTDKTVWWESSNNKVATVSQKGVVSGVKAGTTTITVGTRDGQKKATCKVTVTNPVVKVKSVKLNKKTASIKAGKTVTLKATITPSNATTKTVTWKTSNKKIATVTSKGVVKGIKTGTATITVTTKDGKKTAKCKATVK